jgi:hypothetical protein
MDKSGKATCYMVLRNRRTKRSHRCGRPVTANGVCERHQAAAALIERLNREALQSLTQPEMETADDE